MRSQYSIVLVLLLAAFSELALAQKRMTNIDYLAMGYNIYRGNPLATVVDPGFSVTKIFSFDYGSGEVSSDGRYYVPLGVALSTKNGCNLDFSATTVTGMDSYSNSLRQSVETTGGYKGGEFSASVDYKTVSNSTSNYNMIYTVSTGECLVYTGKINDYFPPRLNQNFQTAALNTLPDTYDQTSYFRFIESYGTHYVNQLDMGARISYISSLKQESWQSLESQGISVSAAAKYSGMVSVGVKSTTETQKSQAHEFSTKVEETKASSIGKPPTNGDLFAWAQASTDEPMPVDYRVSPLSDLFTTAYFDPSTSATRLGNIKRNMEKALTTGEYCNYLKSRGIVASCSMPSPDKPLPPIINSCRLCARTCGGLYPVDSGAMSVDADWPGFFFDYPAGCGNAPYARNAISGGGAKLCCMKEDSRKQGSCKLCTSCGASYPHYSGSVMSDQNWPDWVSAFGDSCLSDARARNAAGGGKGISLCCNQPKMCSFCSGCGGDFQHETGVVGADVNWPGFFRARGGQCSGGLSAVSYRDGIKLCCNSPGPKY